MAENIQLNKKTIIFLLSGVMLTAFLGVVAGSYFLKMQNQPPKLGANLKLKVGQVFPDYAFNSLDGKPNSLYQLIDGNKAVLMFISTKCGPCGPVTEQWSAAYPKLNSKYKVLGISSEITQALKEYQTSNNLTFSLYNDSLGKFKDQYQINSTPTLFGLNEKKEIVFIEFGYKKDKTVEDFLKRL